MKRLVSVWLPDLALDRLRRIRRQWLRRQQRQELQNSSPSDNKTQRSPAIPLALVEKDKRGLTVTARNKAARHGGVYPGMTLADARAVLPALVTRPAAPECDAAALHTLAKWCVCYTPLVGIDGTDGLWLDVTGATHLFDGEARLLADLSQRLSGLGFTHRLAIAPTPGAAWALARYGPDQTILPPFSAPEEQTTASANQPEFMSAYQGRDRGPARCAAPATIENQPDHKSTLSRPRLRPGASAAPAQAAPKGRLAASENNPLTNANLTSLPVAALRLDAQTVNLLNGFGLQTIGQLCGLPRTSLKRRFASPDIYEAVVLRLDQMFARTGELIVPIVPVAQYSARQIFAEPLLATESFYLTLETLLTTLCVQLEAGHMGATALTFTAYHADGGCARVQVELARPSRHASHINRLFHDRLETLDPGFGVDAIVLCADRAAPLDAHQAVLPATGSERASSEDLTRLIDRLANRLGRAAVYRRVARESHIPERAEQRVPPMDAGMAVMTVAPVAASQSMRPLRLLECPEAVEVVAEVPDCPPRIFRWRRVLHRIVKSEGPERIMPEWWNASGGRHRPRDYYVVEDSEGRRYWLFRSGLYEPETDGEMADGAQSDIAMPSWHIHGVFG